MRKLLCVIFWCCVSVIPFVQQIPVYAINRNGIDILHAEQKPMDMVVYYIPSEEFLKFIQEPTIDFIKSESYRIELFRTKPSVDLMDYIKIENKGVQYEQIEDGFMRIRHIEVHRNLVNFVNIESLEMYLSSCGIQDSVINASVVVCKNYPSVIWAQCKENDFYITYNEYQEDWENNPTSSEYVYRVYSREDYYNHITSPEIEIAHTADSTEYGVIWCVLLLVLCVLILVPFMVLICKLLRKNNT